MSLNEYEWIMIDMASYDLEGYTYEQKLKVIQKTGIHRIVDSFSDLLVSADRPVPLKVHVHECDGPLLV